MSEPEKTDNPLLDLKEAAQLLSRETGRFVTPEHLRNARKRKKGFPFFRDPLSGKVVIRKKALLSAWKQAEAQAVAEAVQPAEKGRAA